jgi:hypothetical protein
VVDCPAHNTVEDALVLMTGRGFTVKLLTAVFVQPAALVPVTVYVILVVGVALTLAPVKLPGIQV